MSDPVPAASVWPFDARPLSEPVDRQAVRAFVKAHGGFWTGKNIFGAIVAAVIFGMFALVIVPMFFTIVGSLLSMGSGGAGAGVVFMIVLVLLVVVGVVIAARTLAGAGERGYRLQGFAAANGMSYVPRVDDPPLPGMVFGRGDARFSGDVVRGEHPRFVEFANYSYSTGSGKDRTTHRWGYVAIRLDNPLPNIVLDATSNNGLFGASNLPTSLDKAQRLSLEGDFDKHFTLYAPVGYERDALYLFTPDVMARFIDHAAALDVEIVDDWLFFYAKRDLATLDPATWAWLFGAVRAMLDKLAQWSRWRDERLQADAAASAPAPAGAALPFAAPSALVTPPPVGVAAGGKRLKRTVPWFAVVIAAVFIAFWLFDVGRGFLGLFGG